MEYKKTAEKKGTMFLNIDGEKKPLMDFIVVYDPTATPSFLAATFIMLEEDIIKGHITFEYEEVKKE